MTETLEVISDNHLALSKHEQRLFETYRTSMTIDQALTASTALKNHIEAERDMFENPTTPQVTAWFRRPTLRRFERRLAAVERFSERIPLSHVDWDDMNGCYELNLEHEGL